MNALLILLAAVSMQPKRINKAIELLVMQEARSRVLAATRAAGIFFLNSVTPEDVVERIEEGVMIGSANREAAERGRKHTARRMPW